MKILNPCKKCLVKPACSQMCQEYVEYITLPMKIIYRLSWLIVPLMILLVSFKEI